MSASVMGRRAAGILGSRLLARMPPAQSLAFSTRAGTEKAAVNILFFCPRNEDHFGRFEGEYPEFIKSVSPESVSVSEIARLPENNNRAIISLLRNDISPSDIIPHIVLIGHSKEEADAKIRFFCESGITSILAIRGNPLTIGKGKEVAHHPEGYEDVPQLIRRIKEIAPSMKVIVAGYPEKHPFARSHAEDMDALKRKIDSGADSIVTQHFFDNDYFLGFLEYCEKKGIKVPVMPSIMPIGNPKYLFSFSKAAGVNLPAEVTEILFGQEGMTTKSELITDKVVEERAVAYTAGHIKSIIDLNLPQVSKINTYAANNTRFLGKVLKKLGMIKGSLEEEVGASRV